MKKILFAILVMAFSVSAAFSQEIDEKPEVELINIAENNGFTGQLEPYLVNLKSGVGQAAVIKQIGNNNMAVVTQGGGNQFAYIHQHGNWLNATLRMNGKNNNALIKQRGEHLVTDVKLVGHNNDFKLLQKGTNLSNNIKLLDVTGTDILMLQTRNRFLYSQNGSGNGIPLTIETSQSVPAIIVRNN